MAVNVRLVGGTDGVCKEATMVCLVQVICAPYFVGWTEENDKNTSIVVVGPQHKPDPNLI